MVGHIGQHIPQLRRTAADVAHRRRTADQTAVGTHIPSGRKPVPAGVSFAAMATRRPDELMARAIIEQCITGAHVEHVGDQPGDHMIDILITYSAGNTAAVEVVADHDQNYRRLDARIRAGGGHRIAARTLRNTWILSLKEQADVRAVRTSIVPLLEAFEAALLPVDLKWPNGRLYTTAPTIADAFSRLDVQFANSTPSPEGRVYLLPPLLWGWAADPNQLVGWVEKFLQGTAPDVPAKLAKSGHEERHVFIWMTATTDYAATSVVEVDEQLPAVAPMLPGGITHLWIGSYLSRHRVLTWDAGNGWRDMYRIPDDGVIPFE
jgi:hypothetical protein